MRYRVGVLAVGLAFAATAAQATVHDVLFRGTFDIPADAPASDADAARFLTQATFGPTTADIAYVRAQGISEWIDEQLAKPTTLAEPTVEAVVNARTAGGQGVGQSQRLNRFYWQAVYAPDQLRQRMSFALSQIFVVSDASSAINQDVVPMSHYHDLLANDAFGSFLQLLTDVTLNPTMGKYLNAYHNTAPVCKGVAPNITCTSPDENYAREVMQLFSIGLVELNMDHSPYLTNPLDPTSTVPTYDQTTITHTAKVFTGFTYSDAPTNPANFYGGPLSFAGAYNPMACWGTELFPFTSSNMKHDITGDDDTPSTSKTVVSWFDTATGTMIPNTILPGQNCVVLKSGHADIPDEMGILAGHTNVPPFISRQLIQRFVSSNPSAAYIQRVATVFDTPGNDLGDAIKAILTDTEARNPPALNSGDIYGKLREPVLRLTAMWRAFNAKAPAPDTYGEVKMIGGGGFQNAMGQNPLESPTVFNFYLPDYMPPSLGGVDNNSVYAPEFQILNESSTYTTANLYYGFTEAAFQGMTSPPTDRPLIDLSSLTVNASSPTNIVDTINSKMLYGTMSTSMNTRLFNMLDTMMSGGTSAAEMAWSAIYVTMLSPEYATQR